MNEGIISLCCVDADKLYLLDTNGRLMKEYGPGITITGSEDAEQSHSANPLNGPIICQADAAGALMVADV